MAARDRSPTRAPRRARRAREIEWSVEWHEGHYTRRRFVNSYRLSNDGRFIEIKVSNFETYRITFLIDATDFEAVSNITWCALPNEKRSYWSIVTSNCGSPKLNGYPSSTRLARYLKNYIGPLTIDHLNRDTLDNRQENLRVATTKEQANNRKLHEENTSGHNGISTVQPRYYWRVNYKPEGGQPRTKRWRINTADGGQPVDIVDWIASMRRAGFRGRLEPVRDNKKGNYVLQWTDEIQRNSSNFELSEQGLAEALAVRDEAYDNIENYNGREYPPTD